MATNQPIKSHNFDRIYKLNVNLDKAWAVCRRKGYLAGQHSSFHTDATSLPPVELMGTYIAASYRQLKVTGAQCQHQQAGQLRKSEWCSLANFLANAHTSGQQMLILDQHCYDVGTAPTWGNQITAMTVVRLLAVQQNNYCATKSLLLHSLAVKQHLPFSCASCYPYSLT